MKFKTKLNSYFDPFLKKEVLYAESKLNLPATQRAKDITGGGYLFNKLVASHDLKMKFCAAVFKITDPVSANLFLRFLYGNNDATGHVLSDEILFAYKIAPKIAPKIAYKIEAASEVKLVYSHNSMHDFNRVWNDHVYAIKSELETVSDMKAAGYALKSKDDQVLTFVKN